MITLCTFAQLCTKVPIGCNGMPQILPKPAPSIKITTPSNSLHPSLDRPNSLSQTASGSNQPFFHNSPLGQTDRLTHGICENSTPIPLTLYRINGERCAMMMMMMMKNNNEINYLSSCIFILAVYMTGILMTTMHHKKYNIYFEVANDYCPPCQTVRPKLSVNADGETC